MKRNGKPYDYGKCHDCGARMEERLEDQPYRVQGHWILVRNVPAGVCVQCGAGVLRAPIAKKVEKLLRGPTEKSIRMRVAEFASA